ncbi:MAG: tRNA (N6-isopentenyl adenosine(37)-C2)-methylthiotransferase MiaB [Planctomycetaceae bacterium]|jgi:tRNA-2-methylthio-N6-dimethylallyladenosine synthase|nr:tRNA (N6-isopentenyl adenosine(37)-C2)-methylthiotransferase MiaB [Planctomycetaceae bacterium]
MRFYIETLGCQMNVLDSELAASALIRSGLTPAKDKFDADVILFNTCSVRQHAEDKVYSALGRLKVWKDKKPCSVLGVIGCMAQKEQKNIFHRVPFVDFVLGPGSLDALAETVHQLLDEKVSGSRQAKKIVTALNRKGSLHSDLVESYRLYNPDRTQNTAERQSNRETAHPALIRIMFGCNQFCSYCIVPYVRGPEQSRMPEEIIAEVQSLVRQGVSKITFIGQTVNSYIYRDGGKTVKLADLLYEASKITGLEEIDFVTGYPKGVDETLLQAVRDLPKVLKHFHIPAQSGSDNVLKRMNRHYTAAEYRELTDRIYSVIPNSSLTSDFIVGFCGETDEEFEKTVDLVKYCRFRNSFIFKYSVREGTKSAEIYEDDVSEAVKKYRNNRLLEVQKQGACQS